jgi:inactive STAND/TIR domain
MTFSRPVRAFYSYSHRNRAEQERLETFLTPLTRRNEIVTWGDTKIRGGADWRAALDAQMAAAEIFLLLVTADYIGSDECWKELQAGLDRAEERKARVIPIIGRPCGWKTIPEIERWQALPKGGQPVIRKGSQPEQEWQSVAAGIQAVVNEMCTTEVSPSRQTRNTAAIPELLPFLCDRSVQEESFRKALALNGQGGPFVCILHGDAQQAHKEFVRRLECAAIPEVLDCDPDSPIHHPRTDLMWLGLNASGSANEIFGPELADILDPSPEGTSMDRLAAAIARKKGVTVVYSAVSAREWNESGPVLLDRFIEFWRGWPELPPGQHLIVFLALRYLETGIQGANESIAAALERYVSSANPKVIALPSISPTDVEEWLEDPRIQRICNTTRLYHQIPSIYGGAKELAMEPLAGMLDGLLRRYRL